ncbi:MAG: hypothetical protein HKN73_20530 [Gemmatimonadetes bacterium]|nr:hypothetical protein [Gemmatimonadota bacterium]
MTREASLSTASFPVADPRTWARICLLFELAAALTPHERERLFLRYCREPHIRALVRRMLDADGRSSELDVMFEAMETHRARLRDHREEGR